MEKSSVPVFLTAGFRFFFLAAGIFGAAAMAFWIFWLTIHHLGGAFVSAPMAMAPHHWHAHEMIYGYTVAVMAGFFLTAVPNWTGAPSARAAYISFTGVIWLAGRSAIWFSAHLDPLLVAAIDLAFIPLLMQKIGGNLLKKTQARNLVFLGLLIAMLTGNIIMHLEWIGWIDDGTFAGARLGIFTSAAMIVIIGGRVVPGFTRNALNRRGHVGAMPSNHPIVDRVAIASSVLTAVLSAFASDSILFAGLCLVAGAANIARVAGWRGQLTVREPILWVLHAAFAMVGLSYLGFATSHFLAYPTEVGALHLMAIGAVGTMTLAMMTRASLGHTGRQLVVARPIAGAYVAVLLAAAIRGFGPDLIGYYPALYASGCLWIAAFCVYVALYLPILGRDRQPRANVGAAESAT